jgi:hypothetical protein
MALSQIRRVVLAAFPRMRRWWWAGAWAVDHVDEAASVHRVIAAAERREVLAAGRLAGEA